MADIIIGGILLVIGILALRSVLSRKKQCGGNCSSCGSCNRGKKH